MKQLTLPNKGTKKEMEELYSKYANFMEGFSIFSAQSVFLPFYRVKLKMTYTATTELSLLEEFICQVISLEICEKEEILNVLSLEEEFFEIVVESLVKEQYIERTPNEEYHFTAGGKELFQQKRKHERRTDIITWSYDGLSDGFNMDYFSTEEEHQFYKLDEIDRQKEHLILPPKLVPQYEEKRDYDTLKNHLLGKIRKDKNALAMKLPVHLEEIVDVENFVLLQDKEVFYHEYYLLLYTDGYGRYRLLAHDPCGTEQIDERVTQILEELMNRENLDPSIKEAMDSLPTIDKILLALKETVLEEAAFSSDEEREVQLESLERLNSKRISQKYVMDYDIRKLFLQALETAEKSLYIISPWMNDYIVDVKFKENISRLLKERVEIKILYGMEDNFKGDTKRMDKTKRIAKELMEMGRPYGEQMQVVFGDTHEKVVIWDSAQALIGSFNYLSYSADNKNDQRHEGCIYTNDEELIQQIVDLRFKVKQK